MNWPFLNPVGAKRVLDRVALAELADTGDDGGTSVGSVVTVTTRSISMSSFSMPASGQEQEHERAGCGIAGQGAAGAWLATDTTCMRSNVTEAACCCKDKCIGTAGCRAWQLVSKPGLPDSLHCYLKSDAKMGANAASISGTIAQPQPHIIPGPTVSFQLPARDYCGGAGGCDIVALTIDLDFSIAGDELLILNRTDGMFDVYSRLLTNSTSREPRSAAATDAMARTWRSDGVLAALRRTIPPVLRQQ